MEDFSYWIFLLILYLFSAIMKKRKQKAAYRQMEEVEKEEEANDWKTPEFIKDLFSDFAEPEEIEEKNVPEPSVEGAYHNLEVESSLQYDREIPIEPVHTTRKGLSSIERHRQVGTIKHKSHEKIFKKASLFRKQHDVKMAMIYKEILDKPRALRKRFR